MKLNQQLHLSCRWDQPGNSSISIADTGPFLLLPQQLVFLVCGCFINWCGIHSQCTCFYNWSDILHSVICMYIQLPSVGFVLFSAHHEDPAGIPALNPPESSVSILGIIMREAGGPGGLPGVGQTMHLRHLGTFFCVEHLGWTPAHVQPLLRNASQPQQQSAVPRAPRSKPWG